MFSFKRRKGNVGEEAAAEALKKLGCKIIERNFSCKSGEIDIIARRKDELIFVEVKLREGAFAKEYGGALGAVTPAKRERIIKTALFYIKQEKPSYGSLRFDIITITDGKLEHLQNAFGSDKYIL